MSISANSHVALMLTTRLKGAGESDAVPLKASEWAKLSLWLSDNGNSPSDLLKGEPEKVLGDGYNHSISLPRILQLLDRGAAIGVVMDRWISAGLWVVSRGEKEYPEVLVSQLNEGAPPILFGCGNVHFSNDKAVAVIGSRKAGQEDLDYANALGESLASNGYTVVSGGAVGVDQGAMLGALEADGTAVGVLADSLLKSALSRKYRRFLQRENLTLISAVNPEAGFQTGLAMARNKFIYCLSKAAIVVCSTPNRGGTWSGATENLKHNWVPLWVKPSTASESGNSALVENGASLMKDLSDLSFLFETAPTMVEADNGIAGSGTIDNLDQPLLVEQNVERAMDSPEANAEVNSSAKIPVSSSVSHTDENMSPSEVSYYEFLSWLKEMPAEISLSEKDIANKTGYVLSQVRAWLKRGVGEERIGRLRKPVRYQFTRSSKLL